MTKALEQFVASEIHASLAPEIREAAAIIAARHDGRAVLFYGSVVRTKDLSGLLDFYVLTTPEYGRTSRSPAFSWLWPDVSFEEVTIGDVRLRFKVATMSLQVFGRAARGDLLDTTVWTRFCQPSVLAWVADDAIASEIVGAIMAATISAARFAAVLGPCQGTPTSYWSALFRETYRAEFRVERHGREKSIIAFDRQRYGTILPLAWQADGLTFELRSDGLHPHISPKKRSLILKKWRTRRRLGKLLNIARLIKAAFLLEDAARYAIWKIERHSNAKIALTPWRTQHPILAAPGVLFRFWRATGRP